MMDAFRRMIETWGQEMTCYDKDGNELGCGMAILQSMTEKDWQYGADALGSYRKGNFVALAVPDLPIDDTEDEIFVSWDGNRFEVMAARPIRIAGVTTHLWLALRPDWERFA